MSNAFLKTGRLTILFIYIFFFNNLNAQNELISKKYIQDIQYLEEEFSSKIFFDPVELEKVKLNFINTGTYSSLDEALNELLKGTAFTFLKIQDKSYVIVERSVLINVSEQRDTLLNGGESKIIIGNINDYNADKIAIIKGVVTEGKTGEPLPGAIISIKSLGLGIISDAKGYFSMSLMPGDYTLSVISNGFEDLSTKLKVLSSGEMNIELFEKTIRLEKVAVYAKRADRNVSSTQMSLIELDVKLIKQLPLSGGEKDLIKGLTMLPGIKSTGEFGTGISVRGGGNDQNLFLVEETPIYNPSHVFGLISSLSPDVVNNVTLYKSFAPAEYGERASSIMEIKLKKGNEERYSANGGIGIYSNRLMVEGPILKDKASFIIAGRSSYSDWILNKIPDDQLANSAANFYDVLGKINADISEKQKLLLMFYKSYDFFNYSEILHYESDNLAGEIRWDYFKSAILDFSVALSYTTNEVSKKELEVPVTAKVIDHSVSAVNFRTGVNYILSQRHAFKAGVQAIYYTINPGKQRPFDPEISTAEALDLDYNNGLEAAVYLNDKIIINETISLNAGIRYSTFYNLGPGKVYDYQSGLPYSETSIIDSAIYGKNDIIQQYSGIEPRLSVKYQFNRSLSTKVSYNRNMQYISMISLSAVQTPDDVWQLADTYTKPIVSNTYTWGVYKNFSQNTIETSVELYYRTLKNLTEYENGADLVMNPSIETELINNTEGGSYGAEFLIKKSRGTIDGWISYTYSRALRKTNGVFLEQEINDNLYYPSSFDKPHDINLYLTYHVNRRFRLSTNFTYSTGRAITLPEAIYRIGSTWNVSYGDRNSQRLPDYHRLDISMSLDESLRLKKKWKGNWTISVLNVYGRKNAYSIFFKSEERTEENNYRSFGLYKLYIIGKPLPTVTYNFIF